jgi:3-phenylpropionate/trans-cinnamate dioxygenase ferredoxin reductase component
MQPYRYLIVGGGMTGHAAAAGIRERDPSGTIGMLSAEPHPPYARPPLSKGLWLGKDEASVFLPPVPEVELHLGRRAVFLDARTREVRDEQGELYRGERLLLATGARPRRLPFGGDRVIYFRTLGDFRRLRGVRGRRVVVIGAGFIGSELASALAQNDKQVDLVFPEAAIGAKVWPADLARAVTRVFEGRGVRLHARDAVAGIDVRGDETVVRTAGGHAIVADAVVAGIGVNPDTVLADQAGLRVTDGIEVDDRLQTSAPDVYAAGDVARFPSAALGGRVRIEHEDAALGMGRMAGRIMAGADERYTQLPFFYSDLFDLGYEAVGRLDARLETVSSWKTPFREGVTYYLDRGQVKGVLLFGIFGQVDAARRLIEGHRPMRAEELVGAIHA